MTKLQSITIDTIREELGYNEFADLIIKLLSNLEMDIFQADFDINEKVNDIINDYLIYNNDIWLVIKSYCPPTECNYDYAMQMLAEDLTELIEETKYNYCIDR